MVDEKDALRQVLGDLTERVTEAAVCRGGPYRVKVWSVEGDSRLRDLGPLPRVSYRGEETLASLRAAALRRLRRPRARSGASPRA